MKLLVIGSGGREHAIAWKLAQSAQVTQVYVAPGNGGTAHEPKVQNLDLSEHAALADFAKHEGIRFTVVGPEGPLAAGINAWAMVTWGQTPVAWAPIRQRPS